MNKLLTVIMLSLVACTSKTTRPLMPVVLLVLTSSPVLADVAFEASWSVIPGDDASYEYTIVTGIDGAPSTAVWTGREAVVDGKMTNIFLFSQTGLADTVAQVCAGVRVRSTATGKTSAVSNVRCVIGDFTPPPPPAPLNFTFVAQ